MAVVKGAGCRLLILLLVVFACRMLVIDQMSGVDPPLRGNYLLQSRTIASPDGPKHLAPPQLVGRLFIGCNSFHFQTIFNSIVRSYGGPTMAAAGSFQIQFGGDIVGEYVVRDGVLALNYSRITSSWGTETTKEYWLKIRGEMNVRN